MDSISFSIIIPVFNRPKEIDELLESLKNSNFSDDFEVVIVEDGSDITSEKIIDIYKDVLNISYYYKNNSGPGDSRNYGMRKAKGNYFLIFDSDCLIPENYLEIVKKQLLNDFSDCFGGLLYTPPVTPWELVIPDTVSLTIRRTTSKVGLVTGVKS